MYLALYLVSVAKATVSQQVKNLPAMQETQETWVQSLGQALSHLVVA